jgi:hypothetical protein
MYKKLKEVLETKGQHDEEHDQYFVMLPGDRKLIYDKELNMLVLHEHESDNVKISRGPEDLPYDEQYVIFKSLGIEPQIFYEKLQLYINAEGEISRDGLFKEVNLTTPIQFSDGIFNHKKRAVTLVFTISTGQVSVITIKESGQVGFKFGTGVVEEPINPEYYPWYQIPQEVRDAIENQLGLAQTSYEKRNAKELQRLRERIKDLVKERGIKEKEGIYLRLPKRFGYSNSPFTVKDGKWVPTHSIKGIILTETDSLLECNYVLDPYGTLDNELHYLKLEEIENLLWLKYLVWTLENK